jgi:hypothetical protein
MSDEPVVHTARKTKVSKLKPHPKNYRVHPPDQREHLVESMREHGVYRNVIVASDYTILAGHGVVEAATEAGVDSLNVVRLDLDPNDPRALKLLAGDNEVGRLADTDDRALADLLKEILDGDVDGLLGTGFDDSMLANLVLITRGEDEIPDRNAARAWVGLPGFEVEPDRLRLVVAFETEEARLEFMEKIGVKPEDAWHHRKVWSIWYPPKEWDRNRSKRANWQEVE